MYSESERIFHQGETDDTLKEARERTKETFKTLLCLKDWLGDGLALPGLLDQRWT